MKMEQNQQNQQQPQDNPGQQPGDSTAERIAAHRRLLAENGAMSDELVKYWKRTRSMMKRILTAIDTRISKLCGPDRDQMMDEEDERKYSKLKNLERTYTQIYTVAGEMLDRHEITSNGSEADGADADSFKRDPEGNNGVRGRDTFGGSEGDRMGAGPKKFRRPSKTGASSSSRSGSGGGK